MGNKLTSLSLVFACILLWGTSSDADTNLGQYVPTYQSAWSNGIDTRLTIQAPHSNSISTVAMTAFGGSALKTTMQLSDFTNQSPPVAPRVELVFAPVARFAIGNEYQVRWSTMIPANYQLDSQQPEIITQLHQSSDQGSPPFALMLNGLQYQVDIRGGAGTPSRSFEFGAPTTDEGKVVTWLLNYRPDDTGTSSVTDLYKDGVLVVHSIGYPNAYPGEQNGYLKIGVYKWWWLTRPSDVTQRTMYYGDVQISGRPASQDLAVNWTDPQMNALASTYDTSYAFDWQTGIDPSISIQRSNPADISLVSDPVVSGRKVVRVSVSPGESFGSAPIGIPQAQLALQKPLSFSQGKDYLVRWSTFLPATLPANSSQMVAQIHQGLSSGLPPIALSIVGANYTFSELGGSPIKQTLAAQFCCSTVDQGKWVNWALRYVPDSSGDHAQTQLWKDGVSVYASRGQPNAYPGDNSAYLTLGVNMPGGWPTNASTPVTILFGPVSAGQH